MTEDYTYAGSHRSLGASYHVKAVPLRLSRELAISRAEVGELSQHSPTHRSPYPASSKLGVLLLLLGSDKEAAKLLRGNSRRS